MESVTLRTEEAKTMAESVRELFESVHKVLLTHCKLNDKAMCAAQALGYNGFKRWHRYRSKCFFDLDTKLANELFDKFSIRADFKDYEVAYSPSALDEHLKAWQKAILDGIQTLGTLDKEFYDQTGMMCGVIGCAMKKMSKDYEKVSRYIRRFTESDWLTLDMHIVDDKLHKKYKAKEEGQKWNPWEIMAGKK
jgi:uncharacterized protein YozE (UPF0346 family)